MKKIAWFLLALVVCGLLLAVWVWRASLPQRDGSLTLTGLSAAVQVHYDDFGVPHIQAQNDDDLYRALGFVHAQDRLFQMEMMRRLAKGELAEILGPKLLDTDRIFRTLGLRHHAEQAAARFDLHSKAGQAMVAYLDGVNQFQSSRSLPLEFHLLRIEAQPFTVADTFSVAAYMAYSFAAGFRTEPVLSHIHAELGPAYSALFDRPWQTEGVWRQPAPAPASAPPVALAQSPGRMEAAQAPSPELRDAMHWLRWSQAAMDVAGMPVLEGSNAWAVSGQRTASGRPLLAGDPHIAYAVPAVWYEAHLSSPGFELYGHFLALNPMALLGHNRDFGWSLTMFQNDDTDLVALSVDPKNPDRIWHQGSWVDLSLRDETIAVKGADSVVLQVRSSPHGPVINDALPSPSNGKPLALWWALYHTDNPIVEAFYQLNRADSLDKARHAASLIHAPGLNVVWAHAKGDIGWWAAARLPIRPDGVDPSRILDDARGEAHKLGFLPFERNPQEENPARGFIVSANQQPASATPIAGYYNPGDRARRLFHQLSQDAVRWDSANTQALQLDTQTNYFVRTWRPLADDLRAAAANDEERMWVELLLEWDGQHGAEKIAPTLSNQLAFDLLQQAMADELGPQWMGLLLRTRMVDMALPRLAAHAQSPWWDRRDTPAVETRAQVVADAWRASVTHLKTQLGPVVQNWAWGQVHSLTHVHPLGRVSPFDRVFNVGPFPVAGGREVPNNQSHPLSAAPWAVSYGPSTRRVIDFAQPQAAQGVLPVGQSGVWGDPHYSDQALMHAQGRTRGQWLDAPDVDAHTQSVLFLRAP